jgi:hypothetical protein
MTNQTKAAPHAAQPGADYGQAQFDADEQPVGSICHTPRLLRRAVGNLVGLVENGAADHFNDCFANDAKKGVEACRAAIQECRAALDSLEETAREVLAGEAKYRHEQLAEIEGIGTF